jgi:hypothetical protein
MTNAAAPAGISGVAQFQGTDARPADEQQPMPPAADADLQGGENEQQDALRAHAAAQSSDQPVASALDDTRASATDGSINDNDSL